MEGAYRVGAFVVCCIAYPDKVSARTVSFYGLFSLGKKFLGGAGHRKCRPH